MPHDVPGLRGLPAPTPLNTCPKLGHHARLLQDGSAWLLIKFGVYPSKTNSSSSQRREPPRRKRSREERGTEGGQSGRDHLHPCAGSPSVPGTALLPGGQTSAFPMFVIMSLCHSCHHQHLRFGKMSRVSSSGNQRILPTTRVELRVSHCSHFL